MRISRDKQSHQLITGFLSCQLYPSWLIIAVLYSHDPKFVSCIFVLSALFSSTHISFRIIQHGCCGWYATITMITICSVHCQFVFVILFIFVLQYFLAITYYLHHNAFCNIFCNNLLISVPQCYLHLHQLYQQCHCHTVSVQLKTRYNHLDVPRRQRQNYTLVFALHDTNIICIKISFTIFFATFHLYQNVLQWSWYSTPSTGSVHF